MTISDGIQDIEVAVASSRMAVSNQTTDAVAALTVSLMTEGADLDAAIAALEAQRGVLGDAVVATALGPLLERRAALRSAEVGEQRKLVTVLFADLVGFTVLSRRLDAEDTRDVVGACFARWQRVIEEHGGVVEKFIGDAVMAVFGLHRSREDDAVRAVRAAMAMVASLREVADDVERRFGERLRMRVGLDTGDVVVSTLGERAGHEFVAVGPTVNRASRLQGEAPEDMVLISEDTRRQVRGQFGLEARPGLRLKGIDEPVDAYVVLTERPRAFELERATGVGGVETSTVGRDTELLVLQEHLADVVDESSWRITTLVGDAGVGKSRLLGELDAWLQERPDPVWWFRGRASPSGQNRPHALLRDAVATRFGIASSDPPATVLQRCEEGFAAAFGPSDRTARTPGWWRAGSGSRGRLSTTSRPTRRRCATARASCSPGTSSTSPGGRRWWCCWRTCTGPTTPRSPGWTRPTACSPPRR